MSTELPQLPEARGVGIVYGGRPYEPEWTSHQDAYDEDDMRSYAQSYAQPAVEALERAADTMCDVRIFMRLIGKTEAATALQVAEEATRKTIALYEKDKP